MPEKNKNIIEIHKMMDSDEYFVFTIVLSYFVIAKFQYLMAKLAFLPPALGDNISSWASLVLPTIIFHYCFSKKMSIVKIVILVIR